MPVLALVACSRAAVPITLGPAHELLVPATIGDAQVTLQLDTGASTTTLSKATSTRLHLVAVDTDHHAVGAAGAVSKLERVHLPNQTSVANVGLGNWIVSVIDFGANSVADGVLGMDVLGLYLVDVDLSHATFALRSRSDPGWRSPDLVDMPCRVLEGGQVAIDATLDGRAVTAIIDLGSNASFANELAAPQHSDATVRIVTATVGADGHAWKFRGFDDIPIAIAGVALVAHTLLVADLPIFSELGLASRPAVILGTDLLGKHRVVIDARHRHAMVSR